MAEPKKKLTRTRSRSRRSANEQLKSGWGTLCPHCKNPLMPHTVCLVCGYYGDKQVLKIKDKKPKA